MPQTPQLPYSPKGYTCNKKSFSVSRNASNEEVAYVLNFKKDSTGQQLVIEAWTRASLNGTFSYKRTILPTVPYRFITSDSRFVEDLKGSWASQSVAGGPLFNPGLTDSDNTVTGLPTLNNDYEGFVELNLTRDQVSRINRTRDYSYQKSYLGNDAFSTDYITRFRHSSITVNDMQAGMIVKNKDVSTDTIYLFMTTIVDIEGQLSIDRYLSSISAWLYGERRRYTYSIPLVLKLEISRTQLVPSAIDYKLLPISWAYILSTSTGTNSFVTAGTKNWLLGGIINSSQGGSLTTKSWNFNVIPGVLENNRFSVYYNPTYFFKPMTYGSVIDGTWDSTNSRLHVTVAHGSYHLGEEKQIQTRESLAFDFSTTYCQEVARVYHGSSGSAYMMGRISATYNDGYILIAITQFPNRPNLPGGNSIVFFITNATTLSTKFFNLQNFSAGDITNFGSYFLFSGWNGSNKKLEIYKSSTISSLPALFNNRNGTSLNGFTLFGTKTYLPERRGPYSYHHVVGSLYYPINADDNTVRAIDTPNLVNFTFWPIVTVLYDSIVMVQDIKMAAYFKARAVLTNYTNSDFLDDNIGPISQNDDGVGTNYFRIRGSANGIGAIHSIVPYTRDKLELFGSGNIGYWVDPTFTSEDGNGLKCTFYLNGCSGVYKASTGTSAWEYLSNGQQGVPIDFTNTRNDLQVQYGGNYEAFLSVGGSGNYWAGVVNPPFTFSMKYEGKELTVDYGDYLAFVNYKTDGTFGVHVHTRLDLEGVIDTLGRSYDEVGYNLQSVIWALAIHTPDVIYRQGTVDIKPPSPTSSITNGGTYKTISDSESFTITRGANTTIRDIKVMRNQTELIRVASPYVFGDTLSDILTVDTSTLNKGDTVNVTYKPLYYDSRGTYDLLDTEIITKVKGHKCYLDDVFILINGVDKTNDITRSKEPYLYLDPGAASTTIELQCDVLHEEFSSEAYPSSLQRVYPIISKTYMMLVPPIYPLIQDSLGVRLREEPPLSAPTTYPNNSYILGDRLVNIYNITVAGQRDSNTHGGTTIELNSESLTAAVTKTGPYQIYLIVEDEFGQRSAWCITNISDNYQIPFRRA